MVNTSHVWSTIFIIAVHHVSTNKATKEYQENMRQAREILKGNTREVSKYLYDMMMKNAELLKFEIAEEYKRKVSTFG